MIEEILKLIDAYWKFDEAQQPMSSWHDKQDLLTAIEQLKNCNLQNVNVSALLEERKQYKLNEIWGCSYDELSDKEKYQMNVDLGIVKDFLEWMHSR